MSQGVAAAGVGGPSSRSTAGSSSQSEASLPEALRGSCSWSRTPTGQILTPIWETCSSLLLSETDLLEAAAPPPQQERKLPEHMADPVKKQQQNF